MLCKFLVPDPEKSHSGVNNFQTLAGSVNIKLLNFYNENHA
jgi:hypothetical protein